MQVYFDNLKQKKGGSKSRLKSNHPTQVKLNGLNVN